MMELVMAESTDYREEYRNRLWKRLAEIDERFFEPDNGRFLFNGRIEALSKEHVISLLNELSLENYNDFETGFIEAGKLPANDIEIHEFDVHNMLFYFDENSVELWTLCPVIMSLFLGEYELTERLIDNGYPIYAFSNDFEFGDCYIREYDFGSPFDDQDNDFGADDLGKPKKGIKSLQDYHMVNIDDFLLIKRDIPDSLADKLLARRGLNLLVIPSCISSKYRVGYKFGKPDMDHILRLFVLPNGFSLLHDLIRFSQEMSFDLNMKIHSCDGNIYKNKEAYEALMRHLNDGIKCQIEVLKRLISDRMIYGFEDVTANHQLIPFGNIEFRDKEDYEIQLDISYALWEKRKTLLKISEAVPSMYDYCYIEAVKEMSYLRYMFSDHTSVMTKKQQNRFIKLMKENEEYLRDQADKFSNRKSFLNSISRHFSDSDLNRYCYSGNNKSCDIECCLSSFEYLLSLGIWGYKEKVSSKQLRYINMMLKNIKRISAEATREFDDGGFSATEDKEVIQAEAERLKNGLISGFVGVLYYFDYYYLDKINKTMRKEIEKCLNYSIDMENQELVIFLFESGILPKESIEAAKTMAIKKDRLKIIPALIGLEGLETNFA